MFLKHYAPNRCQPRIEVIVKIPKNKSRDGGCEFWLIVKMPKKQQKNNSTTRDGVGWVDVIQELKSLCKMQNNVRVGGGGGGVPVVGGGGGW